MFFRLGFISCINEQNTPSNQNFSLFIVSPSEVDHCRPNPCQHGGDCVETENGYKCHCQAQYQGTRCEGSYTVIFRDLL